MSNTFVKFSNFVSQGGAFDSLFRPGRRVSVHSDCSRGRVFAPFEPCFRGLSGGWLRMKLIVALVERGAVDINL